MSKSKSLNATTLNMKGDGYYDDHSQVQNLVLVRLLPLLYECLAAVPTPAFGQPFGIVDYGCSEGKNSIYVVRAAIEKVRASRPEQAFSVVHEDLPTNNFNRLFQQLHEFAPYDATPESPVHVFASGTSFYSAVVPPKTVHLGISSSALHWTSVHPVIANHIYHCGATAEEQAIYAAAAAEDWQKFLVQRAQELVDGGRLIVTMAARFDDSESISDDTYSAQLVLELLNDILEQLVVEGKIERSSLDAFSIPIYSRSKDEIIEPVVNGAVKDVLSFESLEIEIIPCPFHEAYKQDGDAGDYADGLTGIVRAISEPVLLRALFQSKERRRSELKASAEQKLADTIFERFHAAVLEDPDRYTFYPKHATLVLKKNSTAK